MGFTPEQIKGRIKSVAKQNNADARTLMRIYMMERFLERLAQSEYRDNFIIKGGILVTAMIGVAHRSTMDIDTSMKNLNLSAEDALRVVNRVKDIDLDDGVSFDVKDVSKVAPVSTTVDLVVEVLRVSEVNPDTEMTDGSKEVILVDKEVVKKAPVAAAVKNDLSTELTPSTYAEPTTAEPSTAESSTEATKATEKTQESTKDTIAPVTSQDATSVTQPVTKKISSTSDTPDTSDNGGNNNANAAVQTGEAPLAVVILTLLIGSTCVMFVLRKKEEIL